MHTPPKTRAKNQSGFSLIEIMVGVAIGLLGIVVIFQVLSVFEGRKRTTGTGSDAQISGNIAMFNLERDLKHAGDGFGMAPYSVSNPYMGCTVTAYDAARPTPSWTFFLRPVEIVNAGAATAMAGADTGTQEIHVLYGSASWRVDDVPFSASTTTSKTVDQNQSSAIGLRKGELIVIHENGTTQCALAEITRDGLDDPSHLTIYHYAESYTNYLGQNVTSSRYNGGPVPSPAFTFGQISNLGIAPHRDIWQISGGKLRWQNDLIYTDDGSGNNTWSEVAEGIVNLQAQYGVDANNNGMIETSEWQSAAPASADWTKVRAIRVALLARSQEYEKSKTDAGGSPTYVTPAAKSWDGGTFVMLNTDSTSGTPADPTLDWRNYRYRVYQATIPIRNVIWGTSP